MRARATQVSEDVGVVAPGFFQGIRQDGKTDDIEFARWHDTLFVGGSGEVEDGRGQTSGVDGDGAEWVAEDVPKDGPK